MGVKIAFILGVLTLPVGVFLYMMGKETLKLYRVVISHGGEDPKILNPAGRVIQRILQALTGRHREV